MGLIKAPALEAGAFYLEGQPTEPMDPQPGTPRTESAWRP